MSSASESKLERSRGSYFWLELAALLGVFFFYAGDAPPSVNEAHYLVKAKNFWQPEFCQNDLFASSGKAHTTFYWLLGWPTLFVSLQTTAWIGRAVGWTMVAIGLIRLASGLGLRQGASLLIAVVWLAGIERGNLAGEWVIGGIEAKVPAYGLVLMGLAELVRRQWNRVWVFFGAASAFHVLTGGWSVVAAMFAFLCLERSPWAKAESRQPFFTGWLVLGGLLSLAGLVPALSMSWGTPATDSAEAAKTYAFFRISHHLLPSAFHADWYWRHGFVTALALAAAWWCGQVITCFRRRVGTLVCFSIGAMLISLVGLAVGELSETQPELAAKLLRFYWFRLADATTPLLLACCVACVLQGGGICSSLSGAVIDPQAKTSWQRLGNVIASWLLVGLAAFWLGQSAWNRVQTGVPVSVSNRLLGLEPNADYASQRRVMSDWLAVCRFVRASTPEDAVLLTPRHQQTFKWYAHRAEVVNWKDVPQDAASLLEWKRRFAEIYPARLSTMRVTIQYAHLRRFRQEYGVDLMVVDRRVVGPNLPLVLVYPQSPDANQTYAVYELPR